MPTMSWRCEQRDITVINVVCYMSMKDCKQSKDIRVEFQNAISMLPTNDQNISGRNCLRHQKITRLNNSKMALCLSDFPLTIHYTRKIFSHCQRHQRWICCHRNHISMKCERQKSWIVCKTCVILLNFVELSRLTTTKHVFICTFYTNNKHGMAHVFQWEKIASSDENNFI